MQPWLQDILCKNHDLKDVFILLSIPTILPKFLRGVVTSFCAINLFADWKYNIKLPYHSRLIVLWESTLAKLMVLYLELNQCFH